MILGMITIANAQIDSKNELKLTPEMEEVVVTQIKNLPEKDYFQYGITDISQLTNLHLGEPIPMYHLTHDTLQFVRGWYVTVMSDGEPLFLVRVMLGNNEKYKLSGLNYMAGGAVAPAEGIQNYEHKDLIIGAVCVPSHREVDYLIIRKENQDVFVEMYDVVTDEYLKGKYFINEFSLSELNNHLKETRREAQMRYRAQVANKSELILTPELTEMLINQAYSSHINSSEQSLSNWGIKERSQLEHLYLGKPIPNYIIVNEKLTFAGRWDVPIMSGGEHLFLTTLELGKDGQYSWAGSGGAAMAKLIHNYEYKDLIIGDLNLRSGIYLIIRRDNKDIFVQVFDRETGEYVKNEYSFSEVLNLLKK